MLLGTAMTLSVFHGAVGPDRDLPFTVLARSAPIFASGADIAVLGL